MEDTQWNDVLRQKGIIPPKSKEAEVTEEQIEEMVESVVKTYTSNGKFPFKLNKVSIYTINCSKQKKDQKN
jgi:hypothetical protein